MLIPVIKLILTYISTGFGVTTSRPRVEKIREPDFIERLMISEPILAKCLIALTFVAFVGMLALYMVLINPEFYGIQQGEE